MASNVFFYCGGKTGLWPLWRPNAKNGSKCARPRRSELLRARPPRCGKSRKSWREELRVTRQSGSRAGGEETVAAALSAGFFGSIAPFSPVLTFPATTEKYCIPLIKKRDFPYRSAPAPRLVFPVQKREPRGDGDRQVLDSSAVRMDGQRNTRRPKGTQSIGMALRHAGKFAWDPAFFTVARCQGVEIFGSRTGVPFERCRVGRV